LTTSAEQAIGNNSLKNPTAVSISGGKMAIADNGRNRVLIYNTIPTASGAVADVVVGQADFESSASGITASTLSLDNAVGNNTLKYPTDVWSNGTKVLVVDSENHRVLLWNTFPTTDGQAADVVLGQSDFTTSASGTNQSALNYPIKVNSDGTKIILADKGNNRVLIWNSFPTTNNKNADVVIGQSNFTNNSNGRSATAMDSPAGIGFSSDSLLIIDRINHRALIYK
ncbi:MAG: hypothetical protein HQK49_09570, partial [Oligoflexia bacterium]|nr:hypothetical protein [Oligoflexia bacterium]